MLRLALLAVIVAVVAADGHMMMSPVAPALTSVKIGSAPLNSNDTAAYRTECSTYDLDYTSHTSPYKSFQHFCGQSYLSVCNEFGGTVGCNDANEVCVDVSSKFEWDNAKLRPDYFAAFQDTPEVCVSEGAFMHPEAAVSVVAMVLIGFIMVTVCFAFLIKEALEFSDICLKIAFVLAFVFCGMLFFSNYFLNAVVALSVAMAAFGLFSRKRNELILVAFVLVMLALFLLTAEDGLGLVQHHSRWSSNLPSQNKAVNMCNNYYRGLFVNNMKLLGDFDNPKIAGNHYCLRNWVAADLFFMIAVQLTLMLLVVAGAASAVAIEKVHTVSVKDNKETEMEKKA